VRVTSSVEQARAAKVRTQPSAVSVSGLKAKEQLKANRDAAARKAKRKAAARKAASVEQARERKVREAPTAVSTAGLKAEESFIEAAEITARVEESREAYVAGVDKYQKEATPLSERVREIQVERPAPGIPVAAVSQPEGAPGARPAPDITETYTQAREELVAAGYREEDLETPFVELGGTAATGFMPPYVLEAMQADIDARAAEEPVVVDGVVMMPAQARRRAYGQGSKMIGGMLMFAALISFAIRIRDG
jgi:hypothetical protein